MGKQRKIEIDDCMPCNKNEEPLLPKCVNWEELWPAIITKALIKLFSYKFKTYTKPESIIGDTQIIYALTGYFAELVDISNPSLDFKKYFEKVEVVKTAKVYIEEDKSELKTNFEKGGKDCEPVKEREEQADDKFLVLCYNFKKDPDVQGEESSKSLSGQKRKNIGASKTNIALPSLDLKRKKNSFDENEDDVKGNSYFKS